MRKNPKEAAEKIQEWTKIDKEVVYIFLGPGGIMTLDPTIKAKWIETAKVGAGVLQSLGRMKDFNAEKWVDDSHIRAVFKARGLDYDKQLASFANYAVAGADIYCKTAVADSKLAGEIWVEGTNLVVSAPVGGSVIIGNDDFEMLRDSIHGRLDSLEARVSVLENDNGDVRTQIADVWC